MTEQDEPPQTFRWLAHANEEMARFYRRLETVALLCGFAATIVRHGLIRSTQVESTGLGVVVILSAIGLAIVYGLRYRLSLRKSTFLRDTWPKLGFSGLWLVGFLTVLLFGPLFPEVSPHLSPRFVWWTYFAEILLGLLTMLQLVSATRTLASNGVNPALLLVGTFLALITVGTLLLLLPRARADYVAGRVDDGAPFLTALYTSTSASCVTGLVVENTGRYWSRFGQIIIMALFQMGGLGIMTSGAVFVALASKHLQLQETVTLRKLLESERLTDVRRLLVTILVFTISAELIGAVLISGLWADLPWGERVFQSLFHSVSAFCNAGFSLTDDSFVGMAHRWEIWFGISSLIITGGLGFVVIYNLTRVLRNRLRRDQRQSIETFLIADRRLSLTSRLVLTSTILLLVGGTGFYYLLESLHPAPDAAPPSWYDAWFQSVTFRTAGFNTVDMSQLQTTTKLFAVALMFIGASPGSTGGGVKTVCVSLIFLSVVSVLRGKERVEVRHRHIPEIQVQRAFLIVALGVVIVLITTFLLVLFENRPDQLIDHLFEATSAFGTVGVSTGISADLTPPSRLTIIIVMFIGRVGPLTLVLALAGRSDQAHYDLPLEKVSLG